MGGEGAGVFRVGGKRTGEVQSVERCDCACASTLWERSSNMHLLHGEE